MPKTDYAERQEEKLENYKKLAEKRHEESNQTFDDAKKMSDVIPFGQPVMPDHHSYKSDISYRSRINKKYRKSFELESKAEHYDNKVKNLENAYAISQDDPEAIKKLKEKIIRLEKERTEIKSRDHHGWELSNLSQNIRSIKLRIKKLERLDKVQTQSFENNNIKVEVNKDQNRIMIYFPGKPDEEIRTKLKRHGFRWSPRNTAWQSYINQYNLDFAKEEILKLE